MWQGEKCWVRFVQGLRPNTDFYLASLNWSKPVALRADTIVSNEDPSCQWVMKFYYPQRLEGVEGSSFTSNKLPKKLNRD